ELKEDITRVLTANNPHAPKNIVRFNFKEGQYKPIPQVEQMAVHFFLEGNMIDKNSDEATQQLVEKEDEENADGSGVKDGQEKTGEGEKSKPKFQPRPPKKLANQFNFCEHFSQTYSEPFRERGTMTEPPARGTYSANVTQWSIYDDYKEDFAKKEKAMEKKPPRGGKKDIKKKKKAVASESQFDDITKFLQPIKTVERMINQNTFDEVSQDFKYFEDASDEFRDSLGTLLPLWTFSYEKSKKLTVTALCWSPLYSDLFAVGLGSYDFLKQVPGMICFYSLKNPGHPEYIFETESGVLCLDLHKEYPYLVCVGFYDGAVAVYKLDQQKSGPLYISSAKAGKHTDPVWQVKWQARDVQNNRNFFSISADGRVTSWTLLRNDLTCYDALTMQVTRELADDTESAQLATLECGTAMDFHKSQPHLFLIATEEGMVHKCSRAYMSQYLDSYKAHHMAVYRVEWNNFHKDIFITCSADWTVKIWDQNKQKPVFMFDLGAPVGDVTWAPYSSTVFAAVTSDGYVHVYDLNVNKYEALCKQLVVQKRRTKLTHIAFNPIYPILICGDDRQVQWSDYVCEAVTESTKETKGKPAVFLYVSVG
ncbi:unnamed protein product, partial [Schistocephalus solidus]|uniref:WD_REPEATS_REGION domain-containing protein n=1 Tax=Schistocephalus solidus TaxID=70667 RepID=A0A183SZJ4_SCHSO